MPEVGKILTPNPLDSAEFLATSASTGGAFVKISATLRPGSVRVGPHLHLAQEERFEVVSGRLTYRIGDKRGVAMAGEKVVTPPRVVHEHYNAEPDQDLVLIQTLTPGLDGDYFFETAYGLAAEGAAGQPHLTLQGAVWLTGLRGPVAVAQLPLWFQRAGAVLLTPLARLLGYRAVYLRFSGEEW